MGISCAVSLRFGIPPSDHCNRGGQDLRGADIVDSDISLFPLHAIALLRFDDVAVANYLYLG